MYRVAVGGAPREAGATSSTRQRRELWPNTLL
jgi:hypothetical protein